MFKLRSVLCDEAPTGDDGAGGAADLGDGVTVVTPPPTGALAAGRGAASGETPPKPPGEGETPPADLPADGRPEWLEDKFWDPDAKAPRLEQLAKSYREAQARLKGAIGMPPKDVDGYKFELADGEEFELDPNLESAFRDFALECDLNNHQYNKMVREWAVSLSDARAGFWQENERRTIAELVKQTGSTKAALAVQADAYRTIEKYATPEELAEIDNMPSHPALLNILARISGELRGDTPPGGGPPGKSFDTETQECVALYRDHTSAFYDARKPGHVQAKQRVQAWIDECVKCGVNSTELLRAN